MSRRAGHTHRGARNRTAFRFGFALSLLSLMLLSRPSVTFALDASYPAAPRAQASALDVRLQVVANSRGNGEPAMHFAKPTNTQPSGVLMYSALNGSQADFAKYHVSVGSSLLDIFLKPFGQEGLTTIAKKSILLRLTVPGQPVSADYIPCANRQLLCFRIIADGDPISTNPPDVLVVFDLHQQKIIRTYSDPDLLYPFTRCSPDGRYVAFILGGQRNGQIQYLEDGRRLGNALRLLILDIHTGKTQVVTKNVAWLRFSWTTNDTLLFTSTEPTKVYNLTKNQEGHLSIYEWSASLGAQQKANLLIDNIYASEGNTVSNGATFETSPNGRWIAYYGMAATKKIINSKSSSPLRLSSENTPGGSGAPCVSSISTALRRLPWCRSWLCRGCIEAGRVERAVGATPDLWRTRGCLAPNRRVAGGACC